MNRKGISVALAGIALIFFPAGLALSQSAPLATSLGADFVTENSARMNGRVNPNGTSDTFYWFEWSFFGKTETYLTRRVRMGTAMRNVTEPIVGLAPNTTYCFKVVAENSRGRDVGQLSCFTTKKLEESAQPESRSITIAAKNIGPNSATLRGYVAPHGAAASYWFEYGKTQALGASTRIADKRGTSGYVEVAVTGLEPNTTYYYRIVSEAAGKRWNGEIRSFVTGQGTPMSGTTGGTSVSSGASREGGAPYIMRVEYERAGATTATIRYFWDLSAAGTGKGARGIFTIEYGPTRSLGHKIVYDSQERNPRGGMVVRIPIYEGGVYHRGTFVSPLISYTGETHFTKAYESPARSGSVYRAATSSLRSSTSVGYAIPSITQGRATGTRERTESSGLLSRLFAPMESSRRATKSDVTLLQSLSGSRKPHEPIEYTIRYANDTGKAVTDAVLRVVFPKNVIYIGDDTNNEFFVEEDSGTGDRTYVLPIGLLSPKEGRTITMMGIMTSDTETNPSARSRISYTDDTGQERLIIGKSVSREEIRLHEQGREISAASDGEKKEGFFSKLFGSADEPVIKDEATVLQSADGNAESGSLVTYTLRYANETSETITEAQLRFWLPEGVEYVGDSTDGEIRIEENPETGKKTYVLPIETLERGEGRTITVTGRNISGTSEFDEIKTEMTYFDAKGTKRNISGRAATEEEIRTNERVAPLTASLDATESDGGWRVFPTTLTGWLILVASLAILIIGWDKTREWYLKKKRELEEKRKLSEESQRA